MTAVPITSGVWLGDMTDAHHWPGPRLCVLEGQDYYLPRPADRHVRILFLEKPNEPRVVAHEGQLELAHAVIQSHLEAGLDPDAPEGRLLVHCAAGVERSPLTLATWLVETGQEPDIAAAYRRLMAARGVVQDRTHWLESSHLARMMRLTVG